MIGAIGQTGRLGLSRGRLLLYPRYVQDYLDRVTAADVGAGNTQGLELGVTDAFNTTLQAMVGDGSLGVSNNVLAQAPSLVKASCAVQGARTLSGALVPLAADMPAPTNFNFVAGDYNRRTGLGDPTNISKHLRTNRNNNADPQNDRHVAICGNLPDNGNRIIIGARATMTNAGGFEIRHTTYTYFLPSTDTDTLERLPNTGVQNFMGYSRNTSANYTSRRNGANATVNQVSGAPANAAIHIFTRTDLAIPSNARVNYYSIGSALDLAILEARIAALSAAIQAAIAP